MNEIRCLEDLESSNYSPQEKLTFIIVKSEALAETFPDPTFSYGSIISSIGAFKKCGFYSYESLYLIFTSHLMTMPLLSKKSLDLLQELLNQEGGKWTGEIEVNKLTTLISELTEFLLFASLRKDSVKMELMRNTLELAVKC